MSAVRFCGSLDCLIYFCIETIVGNRRCERNYRKGSDFYSEKQNNGVVKDTSDTETVSDRILEEPIYINLSESIVRSSHNHILSLLNTFSVNDKIK